MKPENREKCIKVFQDLIHRDENLKEFLDEAMKKPPDPPWWVVNCFHFNGGMWLRNYLRTNGCTEKDLEIDNLDDYYIPCLEEAYRRETTAA